MINGTALGGLDDDTVARLQFDHYVGQVASGRSAEWPTVRGGLVAALEAAGSGIAVHIDRSLARELLRIAAHRQQLFELVDATHRDHAHDSWADFRVALYEAWRELDLAGRA